MNVGGDDADRFSTSRAAGSMTRCPGALQRSIARGAAVLVSPETIGVDHSGPAFLRARARSRDAPENQKNRTLRSAFRYGATTTLGMAVDASTRGVGGPRGPSAEARAASS